MERGTVKTSAVFIATGEKTEVYRTVDEVPPSLRKKLLESTGSLNSGTILIADRRGAQELLRARKRAALASAAESDPAPVRRLHLLSFLLFHWGEIAGAGAAGIVISLLLWKWLF